MPSPKKPRKRLPSLHRVSKPVDPTELLRESLKDNERIGLGGLKVIHHGQAPDENYERECNKPRSKTSSRSMKTSPQVATPPKLEVEPEAEEIIDKEAEQKRDELLQAAIRKELNNQGLPIK